MPAITQKRVRVRPPHPLAVAILLVAVLAASLAPASPAQQGNWVAKPLLAGGGTAVLWEATLVDYVITRIIVFPKADPGEKVAIGATFRANGDPATAYQLTYLGIDNAGISMASKSSFGSNQLVAVHARELKGSLAPEPARTALALVLAVGSELDSAKDTALRLPSPPTSITFTVPTSPFSFTVSLSAIGTRLIPRGAP